MSARSDGLVWILLLFTLPTAITCAWAVSLPDAGWASWATLIASVLACALGFGSRWRRDPWEAAKLGGLYLAVTTALGGWFAVAAEGSVFASRVALAAGATGAVLGVAFLGVWRHARRNPGPLRARFPFVPVFERDGVQLVPRCDETRAGDPATVVVHLHNCTDRPCRVELWLYSESAALFPPPVPMQALAAFEVREVTVSVPTSGASRGAHLLRIGIAANGWRGRRAPIARGKSFRNPLHPAVATFEQVFVGVAHQGGIELRVVLSQRATE